MFIAMGARKLYKSHQEKKAAEEEDAKNGEGAAAAFHQHQNDGYYPQQGGNAYTQQSNNPYGPQSNDYTAAQNNDHAIHHQKHEFGKKSDKKEKLACPNCSETKKINFAGVRDDQGRRTATCISCGTQWLQ